jgi:hypothetical protein
LTEGLEGDGSGHCSMGEYGATKRVGLARRSKRFSEHDCFQATSANDLNGRERVSFSGRGVYS